MPKFQLTRPVWGEPIRSIYARSPSSISTHSPRVGRTRRAILHTFARRKFQLTRPVWGEPCPRQLDPLSLQISTHSPRVGRTILTDDGAPAEPDFNSLAPCGANPRRCRRRAAHCRFQLTRPVWGEPDQDIVRHRNAEISTHSPRVGRTSTSCIFVDRSPLLGVDNNFCSRTDCGFLWCSSANRARFSHRLRFAIRT